MDLLQHLIVPTKADTLNPIDTGISQRYCNSDARLHSSPTTTNTVVKARDKTPPILQLLSPALRDHGEACSQHQNPNSKGPPSLLGRHRAVSQPEQGSMLCFFWYHLGVCKNDPANLNREEKTCPYNHSNNTDCKVVASSRYARWKHKRPCGLELCPWKDETWSAQKERLKSQMADQNDKTSAGQTLPCNPNTIPKATEVGEAKHKRAIRHPDEPLGEVKRTKISYDDIEPTLSSYGDETCFFWYHGDCRKPRDAWRSYQCDHMHALTEPPSMVQPPPGYVHKTPCKLQWCPGDSRERKKKERGGSRGSPSGSARGSAHSEHAAASQARDAGITEKEAVEEKEEWYLSGFEEPASYSDNDLTSGLLASLTGTGQS